MSRPKGTLNAGGMTDRVLDRLTTDGGWLATSLIYDYFSDQQARTVEKSLHRLKERGWVESRPLWRGSERGQVEHEWRVHPDFEWPV